MGDGVGVLTEPRQTETGFFPRYIDPSYYYGGGHCVTYKSFADYLRDVEKCGFIVGPFYHAFIKWVEQNAKHPVRFSMRGAHPMLHTARLLTKDGAMEKGDFKELYINTEVVGFLLSGGDAIKRYIEKSGIDKPFTLVDNGYAGTISTAIFHHLNKDIQTLFARGSDKFEKLRNLTGPAHSRAFVNETGAIEKYAAAHPEGELSGWELDTFYQGLAENVPQRFQKYRLADLPEVMEKGLPFTEEKERLQANRTFLRGLTKGVRLSAGYQKLPDQEQFMKYLDTLISASPFVSQTSGFSVRRFKGFAQFPAKPKLRTRLADFQREVEGIYK
jgi:hypothetical protein